MPTTTRAKALVKQLLFGAVSATGTMVAAAQPRDPRADLVTITAVLEDTKQRVAARRDPGCSGLEIMEAGTSLPGQSALRADVVGRTGARLGRRAAFHVGLALLSGLSVAPASAQSPLCDGPWLAGASEREVVAQVSQGADPNAACNPDGDRPLHHALLAVSPSIEIIQALMNHEADVLLPNRFGKTPWELSDELYVEAIVRYQDTRTEENSQALKRMGDIYYAIKGHALDAFGNLALGRPVTSLHPCYLTRHGRSYKIWPSALPDWPLSHGANLPVKFHMHHSVPMRYRPVVRAAAAEWNRAAGFRAIAIHREIDYSDSVSERVPDSKNLIYWLPRSDHELSRVHMIAGEAITQSLSASESESLILITEVDIVIYAAADGLGPVRKLLEDSLRRASVQTHAVGDDIASLQRQWLEVLAGMSHEQFGDWVIQLMSEKGIRPPTYDRAGFEGWIVAVMNEQLGNREPMRSFDDLRSWLAEGFAFDLERLRDHIDRNSPVKEYLLHEFGHALGLGHNPDPRSLMSGLHVTPVPRVPGIGVRAGVDDAAVHGLGCAYGPLMEAHRGLDRTEAGGAR